MPKIRGLRRRGRTIERWRTTNLKLPSARLANHERPHAKLWIEPWANMFATEGPRKGHRTEMLSALLDVYDAWHEQLQASGLPFYLKIWLFEPRFMKSQVVCAIGDSQNFYSSTFTPAIENIPIPTNRYFGLNHRLAELKWATHLDEHFYFESDFDAVQPDGSEGVHAHQRRLLQRLQSGAYASSDVEYLGMTTKAYAMPLGRVWIGGRRNSE